MQNCLSRILCNTIYSNMEEVLFTPILLIVGMVIFLNELVIAIEPECKVVYIRTVLEIAKKNCCIAFINLMLNFLIQPNTKKGVCRGHRYGSIDCKGVVIAMISSSLL